MARRNSWDAKVVVFTKVHNVSPPVYNTRESPCQPNIHNFQILK